MIKFKILFEDDTYLICSGSTRLIGDGPTVLDKRDGRFFKYGSVDMIGGGGVKGILNIQRERAQEEFVVRRHFPEYDILKGYSVYILKVYETDQFLELLNSFELYYVIPEVESGVIWRVAKPYDKKLLQERLSKQLPIKIGSAGKYLYELVVANDNFKLCDFIIEEYKERRMEYDPLKAKPEDYEPSW